MIPAGAPAVGHSAIDHKDRARVLLTPREQEVLLLLKEGLSKAEISERLVISPDTVKHHTGAIYRKLGVHNRTKALNKAMELGLINLD
jgi:DNA-binding NarL/FixJ family response regulator